jgi:glutaredoxin 3
MTRVKIYTTSVCPFCHAAKQLLGSLGAEVDEVGLDADPELRLRLSQENGAWKTVPMIFIGDRFIGGFRELSELHSRGELTALLA